MKSLIRFFAPSALRMTGCAYVTLNEVKSLFRFFAPSALRMTGEGEALRMTRGKNYFLFF